MRWVCDFTCSPSRDPETPTANFTPPSTVNLTHLNFTPHSKMQQGVANYVILRPLCTVIALITDRFGVYGQGQLKVNTAYPYLAFATNCSQVWALGSNVGVGGRG